MKIRKKLLLTYLLAIIIPVLVTILLLFLGQLYINHQSRYNEVANTDEMVNKAINAIEKHLDEISDYDRFYDHVFKELEGNNRIIIVDNNDKLLFHSHDKEASINHEVYMMTSEQSYRITYSGKNDEVIEVIAPLVEQNEIMGKMELKLDRFQLSMDVINEILGFLVIVFCIGILLLIFLVYLFTNTVSKGVIKPLRTLSDAAKKIAEGQLDDEIIYHKRDEFGEFSQVFDQMRIKLKESLDKQQQLERSRKELVASISHDLRTPITSIKGYVEAIIDGKVKDEKKMKEYLSIIDDKTTKLDRLIDDLFQFSKLEYGNIKLHKEIINSHDLIDNIAASYVSDFLHHQIQLDIVEPIPSVNLEIDLHAIIRVFDNLLQNAKKYVKDKGLVQIHCIEKKDRVEFMIVDNGEGIKKEDLPNIFNRFYRGEKSRSRQFGGIGLGLAICKQIIENHGGKIWVESIYGRGSSFHFEIPIYINENFRNLN